MSEQPPESGLPRPLPPEPLIDHARAVVAEWRGRLPWTAMAGLAVLAFALAWWLARPAPLAPVPPDEVLPLATPIATPTPVPQALVVHVAGAVAEPGVLDVIEGARVVDVVAMAGGLTADADLTRVNLAGLVGDGERVWIPRMGESEPPLVVGITPATDSSRPGVGSGLIDINTATGAELEALPGIGPATAASIVEHRDRNGPFGSLDELLEVPGIGPAKLEALRSAATT